jgi:hypothetical protein
MSLENTDTRLNSFSCKKESILFGKSKEVNPGSNVAESFKETPE